MSMDTTDDLEYAESCLAVAAAALALIGKPGLMSDYCRPTCRGEGGPCGDDTCGCPCHDRADAG